MTETGNRGEWSELYVLLRLLADGRLYEADDRLRRAGEAFLPVLGVHRRETMMTEAFYRVASQSVVELYLNGDRVTRVSRDELAHAAKEVYDGIMAAPAGGGAFRIDTVREVRKEMRLGKLKAPSSDKTDIQVELHDDVLARAIVRGFSIKSDLGSPPTLLNASRATTFRYAVIGLSAADLEALSHTCGRAKIVRRVQGVYERGGALSLMGAINATFAGNLCLVDSRMEEILGHALVAYYRQEARDCSDIAELLERRDPLRFGREGVYRYKLKRMLCAVALGMVPATAWNGRDETSGGYIIVTTDGDVLAYHLYNRDAFETYLLNSTQFETPSSGRHGLAEFFYGEDGRAYIDLGLQIRFLPPRR